MGGGASKRESLVNLKMSDKRSYRFQWEKEKTGRNVPDTDHVLQIWSNYMDKANSVEFNLFSPFLELDPIVQHIFEAETTPLPESMPYSRHLHLVHFCLDYCLKMIIDREFQMCTMALTSLGAYHADLGISAHLMVKFVRSALFAIRKANKDIDICYSPSDYDMITDVLIAVTQTMTNGIKNHCTKMKFLFAKKEGICSCSCWSSRVRRLKNIDKRSHLAIYNLRQQLKEE